MFDETSEVEPTLLLPLSDEWKAEIGKRSAELDAGTVQPIPWELVRAAALQRAGMIGE